MNKPYADRLRAALAPQTDNEHTWVTWLISNLHPPEMDVWSDMAERRVRTAVRSAQMDLADHVLQVWHTDNLDAVQRMVLLATGGNDEGDPVTGWVAEPPIGQVEPSSDTVADAHQVARVTADAFERGRLDGISDARRWQESGLDPEAWPVS